jgi:predicted nucleic acid-binding protein
MLDSLAWSRIEIHDVASGVPCLMQDYGLQSYDAVHAATMMASEATDFVTRDGGFAVLPPAVATLHTTQARLPSVRARRRRAGH